MLIQGRLYAPGLLLTKRSSAACSIPRPCFLKTSDITGKWVLYRQKYFSTTTNIATTSSTPDLGRIEQEGDNFVTLHQNYEGIYRRTRKEHARIFRWGLGNKFRSDSRNRRTPVHAERPKQLMVRDDYYDTESPNVFFEELNEQWEVMWYEHYKWQSKPFPVKKFGLEASKREALEFHKTVAHLAERPKDDTDPRLSVPSLHKFDEISQREETSAAAVKKKEAESDSIKSVLSEDRWKFLDEVKTVVVEQSSSSKEDDEPEAASQDSNMPLSSVYSDATVPVQFDHRLQSWIVYSF